MNASTATASFKNEPIVKREALYKKQGFVLTLLIAVLTAYYGFFVWDVPFTNDEVGDNILGAIETPWHTHGSRVLNPRTEKWAVMGGRELLPVRVTQPMLFKLFYEIFGERLDTPIAIYRILLGPLLGVLVFWFLRRMSVGLALSFLGSVFILTTLPFGMAIAEIREHEPLAQVFLLLYALGFCSLVQRCYDPGGWSNTRFAWAALGLWLLGMLAIRSKEPAKLIVPAISMTVLFFSRGTNVFALARERTGHGRVWILLFLSVLLTVPLVWHKDYTCEFDPARNFATPLKILFWNTNGWEPERMPAFFNFRPGLPSSFFGMLGPVLSWCALGALLFVLLKGRHQQRSVAYVPMLFIWLGAALFIYMHWDKNGLWDQRLMTGGLLPFACLIFLTFQECLVCLKRPAVLRAILFFLLSIQILWNIKHTLYLFGEYGGKDWTTHRNSRREVYGQLTGKQNATGLDLNRFFYQSREYSIARKDAMWPCPGNFLDPGNPLASEYEKLLRQHGYFFLASYSPQPESQGVRFVKKLDCLNKSPYAWFIKHFLPHKKGDYFLYKVTQLPWAHS